MSHWNTSATFYKERRDALLSDKAALQAKLARMAALLSEAQAVIGDGDDRETRDLATRITAELEDAALSAVRASTKEAK